MTRRVPEFGKAAGSRLKARPNPIPSIGSAPIHAAGGRSEGGDSRTVHAPLQRLSGTQHTYWVYVPAQYDPAVPAA